MTKVERHARLQCIYIFFVIRGIIPVPADCMRPSTPVNRELGVPTRARLLRISCDR